MNWDTLDMSKNGIARRAAAKARVRKFSQVEEEILVGWILYQDLAMFSSTTSKFREFVGTYFGKFLNSSYISKFMSRWHLSLKLVGNASSREALKRSEVR